MRYQIAEILIERGYQLISKTYGEIKTGNSYADDLLNDLTNYPHAFVLGCIMDRQIKAEKAFLIPYEISEIMKAKGYGDFTVDNILKFGLENIKNAFLTKNLHRFNSKMAENFYYATVKIKKDYGGDASRIWKGIPSSATVVKRFLEFPGAGVKIATMAANILVRSFKVPMRDLFCIDISPDVHVKRVFRRVGFIPKSTLNENEMLIYTARELYPIYPGIFDAPCWEIGRNWCKPTNPECNRCYLNKVCPKIV